jgi:hypothetical protein
LSWLAEPVTVTVTVRLPVCNTPDRCSEAHVRFGKEASRVVEAAVGRKEGAVVLQVSFGRRTRSTQAL